MGRAEQAELAATAPSGKPVSEFIKEAERASKKASKKRDKRRSDATAQKLRSNPSALVSQAADLLRQARLAMAAGAAVSPEPVVEAERELAAIRSSM